MATTERDSVISLLSRFELRSVIRLDLAFAFVGGACGVWVAFDNPTVLASTANTTAQAFGVIVGLALAAVAVQSAFMDQTFMRKSKMIGRDPVEYLAPMLFTVTVGVFGIVAVIVVSALSPEAPTPVLAAAAGAAGFFIAWTLGGLLYNLSTLISFVRLQSDAADVPDDSDVVTPISRPDNTRASGTD